jgi:hypothetical protein
LSVSSYRTRVFVFALCLLPMAVGCVLADGLAGSSVSERRAALLREADKGPAAIPLLAAALNDKSPVVQRTAVRLLVGLGQSAEVALRDALKSSDPVTRRTALLAICRLQGGASVSHLRKTLQDDHILVRRAALDELLSIDPRTDKIIAIIKLAQKDTSTEIRRLAIQALWPFYKETVLLRDRPDWLDHLGKIRIGQTIPLPRDGWRFKLDPDIVGHEKRWFQPDFDDSGWNLIAIEQPWQKAGYKYIGTAWYRRSIALPKKPEHLAVEIRFEGIDESAWVWVNGQYVGQHDIGHLGWDKQFSLDITKEVKWGQQNQITVRAMNTMFAGGIWRPVLIEVLQHQ